MNKQLRTHYRGGEDDVNPLELVVIVQDGVPRQLATSQSQGLQFLGPIRAALTTQSFDWRHCNGKSYSQ